MTIAIISDVHANLEALKRVLADAEAQGAKEIVCLGDIVGYGPLPKETLDLVRKRCSIVLAGNHDDAVSGRGDASSFIDLAGDAVRRHRDALDADDLRWLRSLPYTGYTGEALISHGDFVDPEKFYYIENDKDALANFNATDAKLMFVGHTHVPQLFLVGRSGTVYVTEPQDFTLEAGKRYIVNPGSVGYPRESNGRCYSSYVLYDTTERTVTYRFLPFAVASVMQRGTGGSRKILKIVAAVLGFVALAALAFIMFGPEPEPEVVTVVRDRTAELSLGAKEILLGPSVKVVRANVFLGKDSDPVTVQTEFFDASDRSFDINSDTVKKSFSRRQDIPKGAVKAKFTVLKLKPEDNPQIDRFSPEASRQ